MLEDQKNILQKKTESMQSNKAKTNTFQINLGYAPFVTITITN